MFKEKISYENKPNSTNTLNDVVVEMPKVDVITSKIVLKTLYRDNADMIIPCIIMSAFLFCPVLCCVFFYNETFRWYYAILPLVFFFAGISMFYSLISSFNKTRKRKESILGGDFIIKKSSIREVYSEYNSPAECDDYFIKVNNKQKNWIKVSEPIYTAVQRDKTCYMLYLLENGDNVLFLIYISKCTFDKSIT